MRHGATAALLAGLLLACPGPAASGNGEDADLVPVIGVVPFQNNSGDAGAEDLVMYQIRNHLRLKGFSVIGSDMIDDYLRRNRIRSRFALTRRQVEDLATLIGARYLVVGAIDALHINGGPEVGFTVRFVDPLRGRVAWSDSVTLHAVQAEGLLAMGRPATIEAAVEDALDRLFSNVEVRGKDGTIRFKTKSRTPDRSLLAEKPIVFRQAGWTASPGMRVAVIPFANRTPRPEAPLLVSDHVIAALMRTGRVEVVDPGELRRVLIERDIQPLYGITNGHLRELASALNVDVVLDGTILIYDDSSTPPKIDLYGRLRDARTGGILWSGTTARTGSETRTIYDVGRIQGGARLARAAVEDLLSSWFR